MNRATLLSATLLWACAASAEEDFSWPDGMQLHGFLSQGYVETNGNRFFGPSDEGSWDMRDIGVNLSYRPQPNLLFAGQLLSRTAGEMYDGSVRVDYALVDFAPLMRQDLRAGLRLGRLKNPLGLYNDTRDVPFTRPSIFLPQSIYFDRVRNLELSTNGLGIYGDWQNGWGDFYLQLNLGTMDVDNNVEEAYLFANWPGKLKTDDPWASCRLMYEYEGGRLRLAASGISGKLNYKPGRNDLLGPGLIDIDFWVFSAQYNEESWSLTGEYMTSPAEWRNFENPAIGGVVSPAFANEPTSEGWYVQASFRPMPKWELLLRYDVSYLNKDDRNGETAATNLGLLAHNFYAKDVTFGIRWDPTANIMLRAEYHRVEGASWISARENDFSRTEKHWDMFALLASFRF